MCTTSPPFFIVASPRSGTTLLERILNKHSNIFIPPETAFFSFLRFRGLLDEDYNAQSMGEFIDWYLTSSPAKLLDLNSIPNIRQLLLSNAESVHDVFMNLMVLLCDDDQPSRLGEKTPQHLKCIDYIMETFPESPVILMVRDGRAVVNSRLNQPNWETNLVGAARVWGKDMERFKKTINGPHSDRVLVVKYEELILHPNKTLKDTCTFLGEEFEPEMLLDTPADTSRFKHYYQRHWMVKSTKGIDPLRVNGWQKEYTPKMLAVVENEIGEELQDVGYSLQASSKIGWYGLWLQEWARHIAYRLRRWTSRKMNQLS